MTVAGGGAPIYRAYTAGSHGQIHYRHAGPEENRSPLLLLHSCPGSGYLYDSLAREMGRDRTVVAPDFPGFGMSEALASAPGVEGYAAAILELETTLAAWSPAKWPASGPIPCGKSS